MPKPVNLTVTALVLVILFGGIHIISNYQVRKSIDKLELEYIDFSVDTSNTVPSNLCLNLTYRLNNQSDIPLSVSIDSEISVNETIVSSLIIAEYFIPTNSSRMFNVSFIIKRGMVQSVGEPYNISNYKLDGTISVKGYYLDLIPVTLYLDLFDLETSLN